MNTVITSKIKQTISTLQDHQYIIDYTTLIRGKRAIWIFHLDAVIAVVVMVTVVVVAVTAVAVPVVIVVAVTVAAAVVVMLLL